jgi:glycosyltransferase involved in cell wall biosynthesis
MPKTVYVYPTRSGIPALANQYNISDERCRVVNNSINMLENMSEKTQMLAKNIDLLSPEILIIYPGRLTPGKKFEKVAALAGVLKKFNQVSLKLIFCDFRSSDIKPDLYKKIIKETGFSFGLKQGDIVFTSDFGYSTGIPRKSVFELFTLSNLFICPSFSESFGLTVLEAASRGNFLVLNECVPALEELGKNLNAYFLRWDARNYGFNTKENYHPSEEKYYQEHSQIILKSIRQNQIINSQTKVRCRYNPQWIWENQLKPLLKK